MSRSRGEDIAGALHGFGVARGGESGAERVYSFAVVQNFKEPNGFGPIVDLGRSKVAGVGAHERDVGEAGVGQCGLRAFFKAMWK